MLLLVALPLASVGGQKISLKSSLFILKASLKNFERAIFRDPHLKTKKLYIKGCNLGSDYFRVGMSLQQGQIVLFFDWH